MIKEAVDYLVKIGAKKPSVFRTGPRQVVMTVNGESTTEEIQPPTIRRHAKTLDSVVKLIETFQGEKPTVFVDSDGITVVLNDVDRTEVVRMDFTMSDQLAALLDLEDGVVQRNLVKVLRTKLDGCVAYENILAIVRQLEFDVNRQNRSNLQNDKESMGRSIEKEVRAKAGNLPDSVRIRLPRFSTPSDINTNIDLECAMTLMIDEEKIAVEIKGDQFERKTNEVVDAIRQWLEEETSEDVIVVAGACAIDPIEISYQSPL